MCSSLWTTLSELWSLLPIYPNWPFNASVVRQWRSPEPLVSELEHIFTHVPGNHRLLICGIGGSGKTYAVQQLLKPAFLDHRIFQERCFYMDFSDTTNDVAHVVESALASLSPAQPFSPKDMDGHHRVVDHFLDQLDALYGNQRLLIILDGLDRVADVDTRFLKKLLTLTRHSAERRHSIVVCSRYALSDADVEWTARLTPQLHSTEGADIILNTCAAAGANISEKAQHRSQALAADSIAELVAFHPLACKLLGTRAVECGGDLNAVLRRLRREGASYISLPDTQLTGSRFDSLEACLNMTWQAPCLINARSLVISMAELAAGHCVKDPRKTAELSALQNLHDLRFLWPNDQHGWCPSRQLCHADLVKRPLHPVVAVYALAKAREQLVDEQKGCNHSGEKCTFAYGQAEEMRLLR